MLEPKHIEYADCYQGLIKLIAEHVGLPAYYMNTKSWGICYEENTKLDINNNNFNELLYTYYGFKVEKIVCRTGMGYVSSIRKYINCEQFYVLIKVDVSSCHWNGISTNMTIYHYLLVVDCSSDGILKCIDIFCPEVYHEYSIMDNFGKIKKIQLIKIEEPKLNLKLIQRDLINSIEEQLYKSPTYSENIISFAKSDFLINIFQSEDPGEYDMYLLAIKRLVFVRSDLYEIMNNLGLDKRLADEWNYCIKLWRKLYNYFIRNKINRLKAQSYIEKTRLILYELSEIEEPLMNRILQSIKENKVFCN